MCEALMRLSELSDGRWERENGREMEVLMFDE